MILTEEGRVKIIDFGLALRFRNLLQTRHTQKGDILGTPSYMSPEQLNQDEKLDIRSDIWSLGILLYALGTGEPPFTGKDFACTLRNVMLAEPAPLPTIEPGFPQALWEVIGKALKKERAERWQDYASLREALRRCQGLQAGKEAGSEGASPAENPRGPGRMLAWLAMGCAAILAAFPAWRTFGPSPVDSHRDGTNGLRENARAAVGHDPLLEKKDPEKAKVDPPAAEPKKDPAPSARKAEAPAPRLREKLFKWTPTERAQTAVEEIARCFADHRTALAAYSFGCGYSRLTPQEPQGL